MLLIFCSIISTSVFGSDFKGNVLLKFPREEVNMETGERISSYPQIEIPNTGEYWSPPDFSHGEWRCQFKRMDTEEYDFTNIVVRCFTGIKEPRRKGKMKLDVPLGFSRITTCQKGRRTTEHLDLWSNGETTSQINNLGLVARALAIEILCL